MIRNGWFEEVQKIIKSTTSYERLNAFKAIGYLDIAHGINTPALGIDIDKIKQKTRQYAKRQLTWIRHHYTNTCEYNQDNLDDVLQYVKHWLTK
jgi:tRNA dimethylallyltransferase